MEMMSQDVNLLIEKLLPLLRLNLRNSQVVLQTDFAKELPRVMAEANRLQQVFLNLIQNAAEAMPGGGIVTIRSFPSPNGKEVLVEFEDNGAGIRPEELKKIFDPFFTTKGLKGTGLGLAICDSIVHDHRGRIEVQSEMGRGSLFRVVLPIL